MSELSFRPDFSRLQVPWDVWSEPFWQAGARGEVLMPRCTHCGTFRWPAGPFCFACQSQPVEWVPPGQARIYSFTIMPVPGEGPDAPPGRRVGTLVTFDEAEGVRLASVLVDAPLGQIAIGQPVAIDWVPAANNPVPVFRLSA